MVGGKDLALLGGVAIIGYGLLKSDFFKGLGGVGSGVGTAFEGAGAGVAQLSASIGDIGQDVSELTSFVGEFGNWTAQQFTELQQNSLRENTQSDQIDRQAFDQTQSQLTDIQGNTDVTLAGGDSQRSIRWDTAKTDAQDKFLDLFISDGNSANNSNIPTPTKLTRFNPLTSIGNFIKNIASPTITGNVTTPNNSADTSGSRTSSLKSSPVVTVTSSRNEFLETLGYQGTSTLDGVIYSQPSFNFRSLLN